MFKFSHSRDCNMIESAIKMESEDSNYRVWLCSDCKYDPIHDLALQQAGSEETGNNFFAQIEVSGCLKNLKILNDALNTLNSYALTEFHIYGSHELYSGHYIKLAAKECCDGLFINTKNQKLLGPCANLCVEYLDSRKYEFTDFLLTSKFLEWFIIEAVFEHGCLEILEYLHSLKQVNCQKKSKKLQELLIDADWIRDIDRTDKPQIFEFLKTRDYFVPSDS